jgi:hypothetical protein
MNTKLAITAVFVVFGGPTTVIADQDSPEWVQAQIED